MIKFCIESVHFTRNPWKTLSRTWLYILLVAIGLDYLTTTYNESSLFKRICVDRETTSTMPHTINDDWFIVVLVPLLITMLESFCSMTPSTILLLYVALLDITPLLVLMPKPATQSHDPFSLIHTHSLLSIYFLLKNYFVICISHFVFMTELLYIVVGTSNTSFRT